MNIFKDEEVMRDAVLVLLFIMAIVTASLFSSAIDFNAVKSFVASFGILAPFIHILFVALAVVISPLPSIPLVIMAGTLFGGFFGGIYSIIGGWLGAMTAFFIARKLGKAFVEKKFKNIMKVYDSLTERNLFLIVLISRMIPLFNFDLISYAAGLTNLRIWEFGLATFIGMIPVTFIFSYSGNYITGGNVGITVLLSLAIIVLVYVIPKYALRHHRWKRAEKQRNEKK